MHYLQFYDIIKEYSEVFLGVILSKEFPKSEQENLGSAFNELFSDDIKYSVSEDFDSKYPLGGFPPVPAKPVVATISYLNPDPNGTDSVRAQMIGLEESVITPQDISELYSNTIGEFYQLRPSLGMLMPIEKITPSINYNIEYLNDYVATKYLELVKNAGKTLVAGHIILEKIDSNGFIDAAITPKSVFEGLPFLARERAIEYSTLIEGAMQTEHIPNDQQDQITSLLDTLKRGKTLEDPAIYNLGAIAATLFLPTPEQMEQGLGL